jgi:DNA (cytosine-5)-methyltransferase 1
MTFHYKWFLKDGYPSKGIESHGCSVFGTFICGGGSSMGYKLAGYNHIGGVEIDPQVADIYKTNHKPKHLYLEDIRKFNERKDLPAALYDLDLLDGSPPCSSFSMAGNRDKDWGKEKQFREGQANQRLDDLVYVYIETIKKLKPKVAVLENVKGLIQGNAKAYAKKMKKQFEDAGYKVQVFLLNAASMGVPQRRERVFFIGLRSDIKRPALKLAFNKAPVKFGLIRSGAKTKASKKDIKQSKKNNGFVSKTKFENVHQTILGSSRYIDENDILTNTEEMMLIGSYPQDYSFKNISPQYLIAMSVPPVMTAQIANQIYKQWLKPINLKQVEVA